MQPESLATLRGLVFLGLSLIAVGCGGGGSTPGSRAALRGCPLRCASLCVESLPLAGSSPNPTAMTQTPLTSWPSRHRVGSPLTAKSLTSVST